MPHDGRVAALVRRGRALHKGQESGDLDGDEEQEEQATAEQPTRHESERHGQDPAARGAAEEQERGRAASAAAGTGIVVRPGAHAALDNEALGGQEPLDESRGARHSAAVYRVLRNPRHRRPSSQNS